MFNYFLVECTNDVTDDPRFGFDNCIIFLLIHTIYINHVDIVNNKKSVFMNFLYTK